MFAVNSLLYLNQSVPPYGVSLNSQTNGTTAFPLRKHILKIIQFNSVNLPDDNKNHLKAFYIEAISLLDLKKGLGILNFE